MGRGVRGVKGSFAVGMMMFMVASGSGLGTRAAWAKAPGPPPDLVPYDLRCDETSQPLGIDDPHPRLSWKQRAAQGLRSCDQTAYRILVATDPHKLDSDHGDLWDSGEVKSTRLPYALYTGKPLHAGQRAYWKVRIRDNRGKLSPWSSSADARPAFWEMGLLKPDEWKARWIGTTRPAPTTEREMFGDDPAPLLRKDFVARKPVASARVYISGLGYYELHLNGAKVGDHELDPGWTAYANRVLYSTYDITSQVKQGKNALGIMLGNGWYNPLPLRMWGHLNLREHLTIGQPRAIAQLLITYKDGSQDTVMTDESWRWHDGPIIRNSVYLGEVYDANKEVRNWDTPVGNFANWQPVRVVAETVGPLRAQTAPPIRVTRIVRPIKITHPSPEVTIVDMGQNFAGRVQLKVPASGRVAGDGRITLRYGELLRPDGTLNPMTSVAGQIKNRRTEPGSESPSTAWQRDIYIRKAGADGTVETYTPRFTFHGFRYVEITGYPGEVTRDTLIGQAMNSDVEQNGRFECSNETYNRIQKLVYWTELSNLFSVQSDCPHREKFGYGGDIVAASEMAMLNFDMSRFYAKTVEDYADAARANGAFTETAPFVGIADAGLGDGSGPVEWGTAHPLLLLQLYRYYGNRALIEAQYPRARRWMELLQTKAKDDILENGIGDHEGIHRAPVALSGTAFYYANAVIMAQLADILGYTGEANGYRKLAERIKQSFITHFAPQNSGRYANGSESSQAFALYYGLVSPTNYEATLDYLVKEVLDRQQGHIDTGIFGTKYLLLALSDAGRADVAATMVGQQTFPGWGNMLAGGATTLWEHWDFSDNTFSHNHPMFGSVSEWFYKAVLGIAPAPDAVGFDHILIHPHPTQLASTSKEAGVARARGEYLSVRGPVSVEWTERKEGFHLTVTIPPNANADVTVPADSWQEIQEDGKPLSQNSNIARLQIRKGEATLRIGSGTYRFFSAKKHPVISQ